MFRLIVQLATSLRTRLAYAPSNRLVFRLRARGGFGSALTAMTVGAAYLFAAATCTVLLARGAPGWLNVLVALFVWNALKFAVVSPVILVAGARRQVARGRSLQEVPGTPAQRA